MNRIAYASNAITEIEICVSNKSEIKISFYTEDHLFSFLNYHTNNLYPLNIASQALKRQIILYFPYPTNRWQVKL